jgi:hypothetical protein
MRSSPGWVTALAVTMVATLLFSGSAPEALVTAGAVTAESSVQTQIDAQLAAYPGGKQINATEIAYDGGRFVITFARPPQSVAGTPDCPSGWYCIYDGIDFTYPRGKLSDCGWVDLTWYGWNNRTESVQYNISTGSTSFTDTDSGLAVDGDLGLFSVGASNPVDNNVDPYRNMVDEATRFC